MKMEKENLKKEAKNDKSPEPEQPVEEIHHHYYMDGKGRPSAVSGTEVEQEQPGEVHYHHYYEPPKVRKHKSSKPAIAGALLIIHAIVALILAGVLFTGGWFIGNMGDGVEWFGVDDRADITGMVSSEDGAPAVNVTISIVGEPLSARTNEDGIYILYNVPTGNQKIKVEKEGYNTIIYKTFINPSESRRDNDQKNEYNFTLTTGDQTIERGSYPPLELIRNIVFICGTLLVIFAIITLIGGYYAIKRENYKIAIIGAITGILSAGILAIIALFILLLARDEFKRRDDESRPNRTG